VLLVLGISISLGLSDLVVLVATEAAILKECKARRKDASDYCPAVEKEQSNSVMRVLYACGEDTMQARYKNGCKRLETEEGENTHGEIQRRSNRSL
jgi:hypothetical protein